MSDFKTVFKTTLMASSAMAVALTAGLALPYAVYAQDNQGASVEEVIVTGSRIVRQDYQSNSPILTVAPAALEMTSTANMGDILNQLPQVTANLGPGIGTATGGQNVNLRGLGAVRSLVLLDGRRLVPQDALGR